MIRWFHFPNLGFREPRSPKGVWDGSGLGGLGAREGIPERGFVRWCKRQGYPCIRTVNLFWYLPSRSRSFPRCSKHVLREIWQYRVQRHRALLKHGISEMEDGGLRRLKGKELRYWVQGFSPHPGRWDFYYRRERLYYSEISARYQSARNFWNECPRNAKSTVLRCLRYSNRVPEAHPDYFVIFRGTGPAFVEVKGLRESIRPSQRRFFPELVANASQRIWLVRVNHSGRKLRWYFVDSSGFHILSEASEPSCKR